MRGYTKSGLIMLLISWITCSLINYVKSCALQGFPSVPNTTLLAKEHSSVLFNITLLNKSCKPKDGTLHLKNNNVVKCIITISDDACIQYKNPQCGCAFPVGPYWFKMNLTRFDNANTWTWQGMGDLRYDSSITFNVTYPAEIKRLTVNGIYHTEPHFLHIGQSVIITCSWENGNPPSRVRLLRSEKPLISSVISGNITYEFTSIQCKDAGSIRCAAEDLGKIVSAMLIVICPPDVYNASNTVHNVTVGDDVSLHFPFCAHTPHITQCQLELYSERFVKKLTLKCVENLGKGNIVSLERESCLFTVSGSPPDLLLVLRIYNVTNTFHGQWRLTLTNIIGSDNINFSLRITNGIDYTIGNTVIIIESSQHLYIGFELTGSITFIFAFIIGVLVYRNIGRIDQSLSLKPTATVYQEHSLNPPNELRTHLVASTGNHQEKDGTTHTLSRPSTDGASIGGESEVKFVMCKSTDFAQVFFVLREQQISHVGRLSQSEITGSKVTPKSLPQYSTLDNAKCFLPDRTEQYVAQNWDTPDKYLTPLSDHAPTLPSSYETEPNRVTGDKISLDQGHYRTEQYVAENWDTPDKYITPLSDHVPILPSSYETEPNRVTCDKISLDQRHCKFTETEEEIRSNEYYTID